GMCHQFQAIVQTAICFHVGVLFPAVDHVQDRAGMGSALPGTIHFQFHAQIERAIAIEDRGGLVAVGMQSVAYFLTVAGFTVRRRFIVVSVIPCFAIGDQTATLAAGHKVFLPAGGAKIIPVISLVVTVPVAETAVVTDEGS